VVDWCWICGTSGLSVASYEHFLIPGRCFGVDPDMGAVEAVLWMPIMAPVISLMAIGQAYSHFGTMRELRRNGHDYHLLVLGDSHSGKSTLAAQWRRANRTLDVESRIASLLPSVDDPTTIREAATLSAFLTKVDGIPCRVLVWEFTAPEIFENHSHELILQAIGGTVHGFLICFGMDSQASLDNAVLTQSQSKALCQAGNLPMMLCGTKYDLKKKSGRVVSQSSVKKIAHHLELPYQCIDGRSASQANKVVRSLLTTMNRRWKPTIVG